MHLLAAQAGALQQEGEAIDLAQTPGDIAFASAADSELMMLAAAADRAGTPDLRLANLLRLSHNLSVDLWLDQTVQHARLVVVRLLGGTAYWQYGVDELTALYLISRYFKEKELSNPVVVSADEGASKRSRTQRESDTPRTAASRSTRS